MGYTRQFTPRLALRAAFTWVRLVGDDYTYSKSDPARYAKEFARNLHFRNDVKEFSLSGLYQFTPDGHNANARAPFTAYVFGGLALIAHNPEAMTPTATNNNNGEFEARKWVSLRELHTEGQGAVGYAAPYSVVVLAIPLGAGVRYRLTQNLNLGVEIGYRYTFTDYLDDVSGTYAKSDAVQGLGRLLADRRFDSDAARVNESRFATAQQLFQTDPTPFNTERRGATGRLKDSYFLTTISIQYVLPTPIKCPPVGRN